MTNAPIVLNCRVAARPTITGVERFTHEVSRRLLALDPERYVVAAPPPRARLHSGPGAYGWEQLALPAIAARRHARLIFSPANLAPLAWPDNVVVVHDAAVLREPGAYGRGYRAWHRAAGLATARRARAVITVSEFSRRELLSLAGLDPERLTVIPGGVDARFFDAPPATAAGATAATAAGATATTATSATAATATATAARRLGLQRPYVLTIAAADPRKNLAALSPCAAALAARGTELVWAGDSRPQFRHAPRPAGLRALGYVPDELLPGLYRGASAFVLPSRYEGFGLTCLEAMASGTPVVAANRAALPEVCGDAALLVDPDDPRAIADAVCAVCDQPQLAARLRAAGRRRAAQFSWDRTASACDALLRALA